MNPRRRPPLIGIYIQPWHSYLRDVLLGIREAAASHGWELLMPWIGDADWPDALDLGLSGVITARSRHTDPPAKTFQRVPHVILGSARVGTETLDLTWDQHAIGRMAARHLLDQGHRQLAAWHEPEVNYQQQRVAGFAKAAAEAGRDCIVLDDHDLTHTERLNMLRSLPQPCGLFCALDRLGHDVLRLAKETDRLVPEQLAVVASGNEEDYCELSAPPMSSVALPGTQAGRLAVDLLDAKMRRPKTMKRQAVVTLEPHFVAIRRSSDLLCVDDPHVMQALKQIRRFAGSGLAVEDVHAHASLSRRALESRFRQTIGRSIGKEIQRVRHAAARDLLVATNEPIATIAERCGFQSPQAFSSAFSKIEGQSPAAFRAGR